MGIPTFTLLPNSGQTLGQTRQSVRNNFEAIQKTQDIDHVAFNSTNQGKHKYVRLPTGITNNSPATAAGEMALFQKLALGGSALFYKNPSHVFGAGDIQLTSAVVPGVFTPTISPAGPTITGFATFLPGNLFLITGAMGTVTVGTTYTVTLTGYASSQIYGLHVNAGSSAVPGKMGVTLGVITPEIKFSFRISDATGLTSTPAYFTVIGILA